MKQETEDILIKQKINLFLKSKEELKFLCQNIKFNLNKNIYEENQLKIKIKNKIENEGLKCNEEEIINECANGNDIFLHLFCKNPSRQNGIKNKNNFFSEEYQREKVNFLTGLNFEKPEKHTYILDNKFIKLEQGNNKTKFGIPKESRSLDGVCFKNDKIAILTCKGKMSKIAGGSQNHQEDDVLRFIFKCENDFRKYGSACCYSFAYVGLGPYMDAEFYKKYILNDFIDKIFIIDTINFA